MMSAHQRIRAFPAATLFGICFEHMVYHQTMLPPLHISNPSSMAWIDEVVVIDSLENFAK